MRSNMWKKKEEPDNDFTFIWIGTLLLLISMLVAVMVAMAFLASSAHARQWAGWCEGRNDLGWNFYCDPNEVKPAQVLPPVEPAPIEPEIVLKKTPPPPEQTKAPPLDAAAQLAALRAELKTALDVAVMDPNEANVIYYMRLQQNMTQKASDFASAWKLAIWQNPDLDYEAKHPQSQLGKLLVKAELSQAQRAKLATLNNEYALIYIGTASCVVCRLYGPLLRDFAGQYNLSVLPVSADGGQLTGWPEAVPDKGQLARLGLDGHPVPLTVLFERATKKTTIVGVGLLAQDELTRRIHSLIFVEPGNAY